MPYAAKNLGGLAYVNGCTLWHYRNPADSAEAMLVAGYFDDAALLLRRGDVLILQDGGTTRLAAVVSVVRPVGLERDGSIWLAPLGHTVETPPPSPIDALLAETGSPITTEAGDPLLVA